MRGTPTASALRQPAPLPKTHSAGRQPAGRNLVQCKQSRNIPSARQLSAGMRVYVANLGGFAPSVYWQCYPRRTSFPRRPANRIAATPKTPTVPGSGTTTLYTFTLPAPEIPEMSFA